MAATGLRPAPALSVVPAAGAPALAPTIDLLVSQFDLGAAAIASACTAALAEPDAAAEPGRALWDACRSLARPRLDDLAQRIDPGAGWDDLVLPELQTQTCCARSPSRCASGPRSTRRGVLRRKGSRGLGVSALFAGPSGTGKTMAAEVLAGDAAARSLPDRPLARGQQVHRRDREEPAPGLRRRRGERRRSCCSTRPTRCSASAAR